jgi:hypothetical protein
MKRVMIDRRVFLAGVLGSAASAALGKEPPGPDLWLAAVREQTGDTPALERLGVWLQVSARDRSPGKVEGQTLLALKEAQEADGYLGVYPKADRLGISDRGVDEYWGTAELGRGLVDLAAVGNSVADEVARKLGALLIRVSPDQLDRDPGQQHPGGAALMFFLTRMAKRTKDPAYARYLGLQPSRLGLPSKKSPYPTGLPPVLPDWGTDPRRAARGVTALNGILALAQYQGHTLMAEAVRTRWTELRATFPDEKNTELAARWARLTADLKGEGDPKELEKELEKELKRIRGRKLPEDQPYTRLLRVVE